MWEIYYSKQAKRDSRKISGSPHRTKVEKILEQLRKDPWGGAYEELIGTLSGAYSRRINIQHRLVYEIFEDKKAVRILRMWTHYE